MSSLQERWKNDNLAPKELSQAEQEALIKSPDAKIYKPFGINTDEIDTISERILASALKKHKKIVLSKAEIEQAESDYILLAQKATAIKNEPYIKRLLWESATEVDYIKGLRAELSPRLAMASKANN